MRGINRFTGKPLDGLDHLHQSVTDLLTTPIGSRVMRPEYGSRLPAMVDDTITPALVAGLTTAIAEAIDRWEPRLLVSGIEVASAPPGKVDVTVLGSLIASGEPVRLENIIV